MHYLLVYPSPGIWGGIETQILRMSHWLVSHGHQVTVLTDSARDWGGLLPPDVRRIELGDRFGALNYYFSAKRLWRSLNLPQPDVVKSFNWEFKTAWIGYQLAAITGARAAAGIYAPVSLLRLVSSGFCFQNFIQNVPAQARLFMSPEQIESFKELYGQGGELCLLPVDSSLFHAATRQPKWGKIVSIGRLSDMKGYNFYMIDVIEELIRRGYEVTWTVHGTGEFEGEMQQIIRDRKLEGVITLAGAMSYERCRQMLAEAYVFVGMGTTILEASLFEVPNVLALAYDREGVTYGSIYRVPLGSVGDVRKEPPTLKVTDEIERILKLDPVEYAAEAKRVCQYAQPYESNEAMKRFIEITREAPRPRRPLGPCLMNYVLGPERRVTRIWQHRSSQLIRLIRGVASQ